MRRYHRQVPDVTFIRIEVIETRGLDFAEEAPATLFEHVSNPLAVILKRFNDYSNNDIERLAWHLGDAPAMTRFYHERWGDEGSSIRFETLSGLGSNRMSPRQITRLIRELSESVARHEMASGDLLPVLDCGRNTLKNYPGLSAGLPPASLVGKTGTLVKTDGGVVALAGSVATETGTVEFFVAAPRNGARMSAARRAQTRWLLDRADGWSVVGAECGADPGYSYGDARIAPELAVGG
jgi:D-alanyl-D-alanine carboxypeptidase